MRRCCSCARGAWLWVLVSLWILIRRAWFMFLISLSTMLWLLFGLLVSASCGVLSSMCWLVNWCRAMTSVSTSRCFFVLIGLVLIWV